jgi:hypothetical protein
VPQDESEAMMSSIDAQRPEIDGMLSFYDEDREPERHLWRHEPKRFMVGDYGPRGPGQVGGGGEFELALVWLPTRRGRGWQKLTPRLQVFEDGVGSLRAAIEAGLLELLGPVEDRDQFARRLIATGIVDRSTYPLGTERTTTRRSWWRRRRG